MNLLDLLIKIGVDDKASDKIGGIASKVTGTFGQLAAGLAAKGAPPRRRRSPPRRLRSRSNLLDAYAAYEQNVGGVQKLFGNMGQSLEDYAASMGQSVDQVSAKWQSLENAQNTMLSQAQRPTRPAACRRTST